MDIIVSHRSAFLFWRGFAGSIAQLKRASRRQAMEHAVPLDASLLAELAALNIRPTKTDPVDLLFCAQEARSRQVTVHAHVMAGQLPAGSFVRVAPHVLVVCPELCFQLVAPRLGQPRAALAGCELCGTYAQVGSQRTLQQRDGALTSQAQLKKYAERLAPGQGSRKAAAALRSVLDGAASPREAQLALALTLDSALGGFGLPAPTLNHPISLTPEAFVLYPHTPCRADLFWADAALDVEYDGRESHELRTSEDVARAAALQTMGIQVMALSKEQLASPEAITAVAAGIARTLGRPLRIRRADFDRRLAVLLPTLSL